VSAVVVSGLLPEPVSILMVLLLVVAVPVAPGLAARVATNLAVLVGWAPVLWWVEWPVRMNHGAVLIAAIAGGLAAYVLGSVDPRERLSSLVPRARLADLLLPGGAVAALVATAPLAFAGSPFRELTVLVPGADNWAHFAMFAHLRAYGATADALGAAPDGTDWAFASYPKSFHALVATLSEVTSPRLSSGVESLVVYAHTVAMVVVLGTVMVTAATLAVPRLGSRPALALPVVVMTWTALLWEPGQKVLANGFASFWLAAVGAGTALLLGLARPQHGAVHAAAVGGLIVCVAHAWMPLLIIAAPAALLVLLRLRPMRRSSRLATVGVLTVSALAAAYALVILLKTVTVGFVVAEVSGFDGTSPLPTFVLLLVLLYVLARGPAWVAARAGQPMEHGELLRLRVLGLAPVLAVISLSALLVMQIRTIGTTSYYFLKYLLGFELVLACVVPSVCGMLLAMLIVPRSSARRAAAYGIGAAVLATQLFVPGWQARALLFSDTDDGTAAVRAPYSRPAMARGILTAVDNIKPKESFSREYLPLGPGNAAQAFYPAAWYHAIDASVTDSAWARFAMLRRQVNTVDQAAPLVRMLLERDSSLRVTVEAEYVDRLRAALPAALAPRVLALRSDS
jgi:hypothetical protein